MAKSKLVKANEKIADAVVGGYKKIEDGAAGAYKKVEDEAKKSEAGTGDSAAGG